MPLNGQRTKDGTFAILKDKTLINGTFISKILNLITFLKSKLQKMHEITLNGTKTMLKDKV